MKNAFAIISFIVVMLSIGCGDKITNITKNDTYMVNTYYSCVGEWVSLKYTDTNTLWFYENKLWKSLDKTETSTFSDSGSYLQDSRSIIITSKNSSSTEFIMIDSITIIRMNSSYVYKKK